MADMFVYSILDFWGMSEDLPFVYILGSQERYDWCFAQALKQRKDFIAILETVVGVERAGAINSPQAPCAKPHFTSHATQKAEDKLPFRRRDATVALILERRVFQ
jgi:hypothetical protein